jgi:hypothetical protein
MKQLTNTVKWGCCVTRLPAGLFPPDRGLDFLFSTEPKPALGPHQIICLVGTDAHSLGVKQPNPEADQLPLSSAEAKNEWSCISIT